VAHHNPWEQAVFEDDFPIRVVRRFGWAHSLTFSQDIATRYRETPPDQPFIIHAGEGTDDRTRREISALDQLGILGDRTAIVHGLGFDNAGMELLNKRRSSIIWCPSSNLLTYGVTLQCDRMPAGIPVALGTDSAISASGDMIDELRVAHFQCGATPESLYAMVTEQAAGILRLTCGAGLLSDGGLADFSAVRDQGQTPAEALIDSTPELVVIGGRIHLISTALSQRFRPEIVSGFHDIALEDRGAWLTPFNIPRLLEDARAALGPEIRLAGKAVLQ
jgi:cytosine/adenosine deaminase-related metal-dependent hydrolase